MESPYLYLFLGIVIYFCMDLSTFRKSVPDMLMHQVLKQYLDLNLLPMAAGALFGFVITGLMLIGKVPDWLSYFTQGLGLNANSTPGSAFLIGFLNQWLLIKIRKFTNSIVAETKNDKIVTEKGNS